MKYLLSQIWSGNMPWCKFAFAHLWSEAHFLTTVAFMSAGHFIARCYLMHREVHFIAPSKKSIAFAMLFCWRRRRDLNPRAGHPTYSLSRGAPSPLGYFCKYSFKKQTWQIFICQVCFMAERMGFEPMCLLGKRFSRPPRYDHFDTSPCFRA